MLKTVKTFKKLLIMAKNGKNRQKYENHANFGDLDPDIVHFWSSKHHYKKCPITHSDFLHICELFCSLASFVYYYSTFANNRDPI